MRLALPASIPLTWLTSSQILPCAHRADMSLDMFEKSQLVRVRSPPLFEHNFLKAVCRTQIGALEALQEHLFAPKHVTLLQKMLLALPVSIPLSCFFDQRAVHDKNSTGSYIRAALFVPKHVTLSQKMRLALPASIPLTWLTSSEILPCAHRADMSLDMFEKSQLVRVRSPPLFEQNFLKAVCRTQIGALEAPWQMTPTPGAFVCSKACDTIAEDAFSVASQLSLLKLWASSLPCHDPFSGKNMQQNLKSWCTSESSGLILLLAHVAPFSSHGDDSRIQYEALFLLSMKSQEQTSYCSYLLQTHHISSRTCCSDRPAFVWTEFLESSRQRPQILCSASLRKNFDSFGSESKRSHLRPEALARLSYGRGRHLDSVWYRPTDTTLWVVHRSSGKLPPCKKEVGSIEAPWQMTPAAACLKGHSSKRCLSNYVLDFDLKMSKHVSSILNYFCPNGRSRGLHCYSIKGDWVLLLLSVFFYAGKNRFFNVSLQISPRQGFHNIQPNQWKAADVAKALEG